MIRIDMSEYQEKHTVSRLIGAPPGYIGYEEGGQLTEAVRRRPYCVVLFDGDRKSPCGSVQCLAATVDDGRLTDGHGRTVDSAMPVVIMTSNLGNELWMHSRAPAHPVPGRDQITRVLQAHFRPDSSNGWMKSSFSIH